MGKRKKRRTDASPRVQSAFELNEWYIAAPSATTPLYQLRHGGELVGMFYTIDEALRRAS
jgi:hypothetical protein